MNRKRKSSPKSAHWHKRLGSALAALALLLFGAADWCAHQPRRWQQAQAARLPPRLASWALQTAHAAADLTDALGVTGRDVSMPLTFPLATNQLLCAGLPTRLQNSPLPDDIVVLNKTGFTVAYSPSLRHPVWAAYRVHAVTNPVLHPRPRDFNPDPAAKNSPGHKDYAKSGYDRGHMVPNRAIAARYGKTAQRQTFLTSNICPQRSGLNQGPWCNLEFRIAELWPGRFRDVWVITGALSEPAGKRLPSGIDIPSAFYQIVVARDQDSLRAFGVLMPQNLRRRTHARTTLVAIDELERLSGLDFLADLPDEIEDRLESGVPTRFWPVGPLGAARLLYERYRRYD